MCISPSQSVRHGCRAIDKTARERKKIRLLQERENKSASVAFRSRLTLLFLVSSLSFFLLSSPAVSVSSRLPGCSYSKGSNSHHHCGQTAATQRAPLAPLAGMSSTVVSHVAFPSAVTHQQLCLLHACSHELLLYFVLSLSASFVFINPVQTAGVQIQRDPRLLK